jgi:hypothetical protein
VTTFRVLLGPVENATGTHENGRVKILCDCHGHILYDETVEVTAALTDPKATLLAGWATAHPEGE